MACHHSISAGASQRTLIEGLRLGRLSRTDDGKHALRRAGLPPHPDVMDASRTPKVFLVGVLFFVIAAVLLRPVDPTRRDGDVRP